MRKPLFSVAIGPDASHWQHTIKLFNTYKEALAEYNKEQPPQWSAVIIRLDDPLDKPARRTVKRQNQYNYGYAKVWCDDFNYKQKLKVVAK